MQYAILVALIAPFLLLFSIVYWSLRNGISPTPSSRAQIATILQAIPDNTTGVIFELGSGWGTLAMALAKALPQCRIIGVENSPLPYAVSRLLARIFSRKNLNLMHADMLRVPLEDASLVVCYLYPGGMRKLKPVLEKLRKGTVVISNTFSVPEWKAERVLTVKDVYRSPVYLYRL